MPMQRARHCEVVPVGDLSEPVSPGLAEFAPSWQWKESSGAARI